MAPGGDIHRAVQSKIVAEWAIQGERRGHGKARAEIGLVLARDPDTLYGAAPALFCESLAAAPRVA